MKTLAMALMTLAVLTVSSCKKVVPEADLSAPRITLLSEAQEIPVVRAAVIKALETRGWVAEQESTQQIAAKLDHKGALIRVSINYEADKVVITGLQADGAGKAYDKWVRNLEASIKDALKKAPEPMVAPPAATPPPTLVLFSRGQEIPAAKAIIQKSLNAHGWVFESDQVDGIVARLAHKRGLVRVRIVSNGQNATINYLSSEGIDFDAAGNSPEYERWMRILVDGIVSNSK